MAIHDPFACGIRPQQMTQMQEMEQGAENSWFVVISDIQLERPMVSVLIQRSQCLLYLMCSQPLYRLFDYVIVLFSLFLYGVCIVLNQPF
jgi:hypothetical protein